MNYIILGSKSGLFWETTICSCAKFEYHVGVGDIVRIKCFGALHISLRV